MTVKEGKQAWNFLFEEGKQTMDGCIAVQKLRNFLLGMVSGLKHNTTFLEKEDSALVTAERRPISLSMINAKLCDFAIENNLLPKAEKKPVEKLNKQLTTEEFSELIHRNGVA